MALIGNITNRGYIQGHINEANGILTGVITNSGQLGGQVVGLRGLKGDKGDTGDTGATGQDGHSPVVTASKVDDTTTVYVDGSAIATIDDGIDGQDGTDGQDGYSPSASVSKVGHTATITITDKDGTTTADIYDGSGGGASAFIAEYGVTTYADVKDAYDEDAIILCTVDDSGNTVICQLAYYDDANGLFYFAQPQSDGFYLAIIASDDTWDDSYFKFASTDTATQLRDGLMSALDWQKLDGIASGAEVNVQSDWNEADNTKDDFIKNKPTIPSKTSDLNNDSGFITGMTILSYGNSTWQNFIDAYNANKVVYCRASSNSNPKTGSQNRLAFMAYVNNESSPTEVEFQYYRSVSTHTASQQGDQVFVYKLTSAGTWTVTTREASSKIVAGTGLSSSYSSDVLTLTANGVTSTSTPTADTIAEFDSSAQMNSTDMTSQEVSDFVDDLGFTFTDDYVRKDDPKVEIDTSAQAGTTDGDLYSSITGLGWASDVISNRFLGIKKLLTKILTLVGKFGTGSASRFTTDDSVSLATSHKIIGCPNSISLTGGFTLSSDGGIKCPRAGVVSVNGSVSYSGTNATDSISVGIGGYYNSSWAYESVTFNSTGTWNTIAANTVFSVVANENIYLRARNNTAARGSATAARMCVQYIDY